MKMIPLKKILSLFFVSLISMVFAQSGSININVYDEFSKKLLPAKVFEKEGLVFSGTGTISVPNIIAGNYTFRISSPGYEDAFLNDISVVPNQNLSFSIGLIKIKNIENEKKIEDIIITKKNYKTLLESPVSFRNITSEEIQKNAGSNRDVSKALLSLPGVATTATFRNDLFIRGGNSAENKFYVDGIEVPVINHFQTQGASGGPRGIITIDFVKDIDFYSGAFPSKRNGVISSLMEFHLKQARKDKIGYKTVMGFDDFQLMADGPLSKDQSWTGLFSIRRSNLQFLFRSIGIPFLPSYTDATFKISKKIKSGDEFYIIGIGAKDAFKFNDKTNETLYNLTLIERLPISSQWNYTLGVGYRHLTKNGNWLFTWSRNMLDNNAAKYYRNIKNPENLLMDYHSKEAENKIRIDRNFRLGDYQVSTGGNINFANYFNQSFIQMITQNGAVSDDYKVDTNLIQYGAYFQIANKFLNNYLELSAGFRLDGSDYSNLTDNPLQQISPRFSLKYKFNNQFAFNFNTGIYYMLPTYTALGFVENGIFVNKNKLKYIYNSQLVGGLEFNGKDKLRITAEVYYKKYKNYPFSLRNQISLANLGGDFGVVGAEPLDSRGIGKAYGLELLVQKRTTNDFYGIVSYTYGFSRFSNEKGVLLSSSWDSRHLMSLTAGKYFKRNWNIGFRFRLQSGFPQTPYDLEQSRLVNVWNVANAPIPNYTLLNSERGNLVHQMDIRVEKKWIFNKWQFAVYLDIVNTYTSKNPSKLPVVALDRDENGKAIIENIGVPQNEQTYQLNIGEADKIRPLPYFGFIFEF